MSGYLHRQYHSSNILPRNVLKGKNSHLFWRNFIIFYIPKKNLQEWKSTLSWGGLHLPGVLQCGKYILLLYMRGKDDLCPPIYPVTYPSVGIPCELRLHAFIKQNFGLVLLMLSEAGCWNCQLFSDQVR